jgi:uncharacterized protein YjaZ
MKPKIYINFIEVEKGLNEIFRKMLENIVTEHVSIACKALNVTRVNVNIYANKDFVIPETGEGGYTTSGDWFFIYIDPTRSKKNITEIINKIIPETIYHEMSHVARWNGPGYGRSLPEAIITEGLANIFAIEKWEKEIPQWSKYTKKEIEKLLDIFQKRNKKDDANYNHEEWFFGTGKLPRWIGYKLGSYMIQAVRLNNPKISWEELTKMTAKELLKLSKIKL